MDSNIDQGNAIMLIGRPPATKLQLTKRRIPTLRETRVEPESGEHRVEPAGSGWMFVPP